ncbi:UNVERIFIED_CONTAM: hypothetical protein Slati_2452100, partial [Sesamum latifolium]
MIKLAAWNVRGLNSTGHQEAVGHLVQEHGIQFLGLIETRGTANTLQGYKQTHAHTCLIAVVYGECSLIQRRELWAGILSLADDVTEEPWILLGDFNAVLDSSEVCGRAADTSASMEEFRETIIAADLVHLPFTGCPFTWHNCSEGSRSLWKRLDRMLVNEMWLVKWPQASYLAALPSTSDHSPLLGTASNKNPTPFRAQRKAKGDLADNARKAKAFLDIAQALFDSYKEDYLLSLVQCCR